MRRLAELSGGVRRRLGAKAAVVGISPGALTALALLSAFGSGALFYAGSFRWGALVLLVSGLFDMLDGSVARASGRETRLGAFLDSTLDRYSDAAVLGGILLYYGGRGADTYVALSLIAMVGALLTSYARSRAEGLGLECKVGVFERPERVIILIAAGFWGLMPVALWVLAAGTHVTVAQRVFYVCRRLRGGDGPEAKNGSGGR